MYINKIDDYINNIIDDFFTTVISKNKTIQKIFLEQNFVKYQKELNDIFIDYIKNINLNEIKEIIKNTDNIYSITETIKRYITLYTFLTIGFNYSGKDDTYINNIVEYTKNQSVYEYKIENFFNSESNAKIIKYYKMIKQILTLLTADSQQKKEIITNRPDFKETILFLNELGTEFINIAFNLSSLDNSKTDQGHNIIKTIIIKLLYETKEKKDFFRLLELAENIEGEYMFIDIVVPIKNVIDFSTVESLFDKKEIMKGIAYNFWDYLTEKYDNDKLFIMSVDEKITKLINSGIIVPITDEFLLYHKDSERYDKFTDPTKVKKKEDTKIRFIINKIDTISEFYSDNVTKDEKLIQTVKKQFYIPLMNRKAISVNDYEEIKIINKFINQGKRSIENNEYFNDLINYRSYPYINFRDFNRDGFPILLNKTIDIVRAVNFEKTGDFKQNKRSTIQMRIGSKDMNINIVGFMIPSSNKPIQCIKVDELINIKNLSKKTTNGFTLITKYLKQSAIKNQKHKSSIFWLFDNETDEVHMETYEQTTKFTKQDQIKHIVGKLYDVLTNEIFKELAIRFENNKNLYIQTAYDLLSKIEKRLFLIRDDDDIIADIEKKIFDTIKRNKGEYDITDDIVFGLYGETIKLPDVVTNKTNKYELIKIDLGKLNEKGENIEEEKVDGVCQHNITWDKILELKKTNPIRYTDDMYAFIQQYVIENSEKEYVCKSCGFNLNIKKYILDGSYDDETQQYVTYSMPMEIPLEDIAEYEKYKISIRNIDKIIEKISMVANIPFFSGVSMQVKWRRKGVVKDVIDITLLNNKLLKKNFKERTESSLKQYGISKDLSNLFVFELDNSIFLFSSKDKDYYKPIKQNNILSYVIFLIILEINDSQVTFLTGDAKGLCNFAIFDKIFTSLFDGLKFRKNNKGDLTDVKQYKIFCYLLYIISCMATKYNMWHYEYKDPNEAKDPNKRKKYLPLMQKILIHTVIDVINSILENSEISNNRIYEVLSSKFRTKLVTTFSNDELYKKLSGEGNASSLGEKKNFIVTKAEPYKLSGKFTQQKYEDPTTWPKIRPARLTLDFKPIIYDYNFYKELNGLTNCINGSFHNWKYNEKELECKICNIKMKNVKINDNDSKEIKNNYKYIRLHDLAIKYCMDGSLHQFILSKSGENVCTKCNNTENHKYENGELDKLEIAIAKYKNSTNELQIKRDSEIAKLEKEELSYNEKVKLKVQTQYKDQVSKDNLYKFIDEFVDNLQSILGNETHSDIYLRENAYIIDHDYLGYQLDKPVVITDKDNKITYKSNHPFFGTDIIYYTSYKNSKVDVFYDATTKMFLGYKEESKNFVLDKKPNKKIKINYSVYNKVKFMGYISQYIEIDDYINENQTDDISSDKSEKEQKNVSFALVEIVRERIENLKKVMYKFQRVLNRTIIGTSEKKQKKTEFEKNDDNEKGTFNKSNMYDVDDDFFSDKYDNIVDKYKKKLNNIKLTDNDGNHQIFKHWKGILRSFYADSFDDIRLDVGKSGLLSADILNKHDVNGNIILFYIIEEFKKLMKYNDNKFIKVNISLFLIDFINVVFDTFNQESLKSNQDIKQFYYILNSYTYIEDIQDKVGETTGVYEEYKDADDEITDEQKEELEDAIEEADALDIDEEVEFDWEGLYDKNDNLDRDYERNERADESRMF